MSLHCFQSWVLAVSALVGCCSSVRAQPLAHWTFDGHADDSGAAGQHGSLVGSATYLTSGQVAGSGALYLPDAHGAAVVNQTNELLQGHAKATLMAWVRVDGGPIGNDARVPNIFARDLGIGDPWEPNRLEIAIDLRNDPAIWRAWGINEDPMSGIGENGVTTGINDGEWHHLAVVFDASQTDQFTLYHNGQLDDAWAGGNLTFVNFDHAAIGAFLDGANGVIPDNALIGAIDDVQIYSVPLTAEHIAFLYDNPGQTVEVGGSGDFNSDGVVDGADFLIWQRAPSIGSLDDWKANFGSGATVSAHGVVPEPSAVALLLLGAMGGGLRVCCRRTARRALRNTSLKGDGKTNVMLSFCSRSWMLAVCALVGCCSSVQAQALPGGIDPSWLVWSDEFNGTALDDSVWRIGGGQLGGAQHGDATYGGYAISVSDGHLTIKTFTEGGVHYSGYIDTSTLEQTQWTYGYYEARIQFNTSPGMWSAFWLNSHGMNHNPIIGNPGATGTEVDIIEHRRTNNSGTDYSARLFSAVHWDGYGSDHKSASSASGNIAGMGNGSWHTYGLLWEPDGYTFYFDGAPRWTFNSAISHVPQFLMLTSEVQHNSWAGNIPPGGYGSAETSTTNMMVDYVRVYSLTEPPPPPPPPPIPALLAHWTFDGHANDSGAAGQHGTLVGSATYLTSGQVAGSGALYLPNAHGAVAVNQTNELLQGHAKATLMAWVRVDGGPVGNDARVSNIFARDLGIGDPWEANRLEIAIELRTNPATWRAWGINNDPMSGIAETGATTGINDGEWHHLAVVFDASQNDQFTLYHNGQLDDTWAGGNLTFANFDHAAIGAFLDGANGVVPDNALIGAIDDVQIYSIPLTAEQISFLYNNPGETVDVGGSGDFNSDGVVDGADFLMWQRNASIGSLDDWKANFGNGSAVSAAGAVPEPAAATLLLVGAVVGGIYRANLRQSQRNKG